MPQYSAERGTVGDQPTVVLASDARHRVRIALRGAALLSLEVPRDGALFDVAWGYHDAAEIKARSGSHFAIMVPFAGRIGDARYEFDGHSYDLEPGVAGSARGIIHGFVRDSNFAIADLVANATSARAVLTTSAIRPRPGYPFAIDLVVTFDLDESGLSLSARMHNVGDHAAPCFFGWHAYLRVSNGIADRWSLQIPARTTIKTDANLIALPGDAAYVSLNDAGDLDFRKPRHIGEAVLDNCYTDLASDADGRIRTHLADPASGFAIRVWQERGVTQAFTGDTLSRGARTAIALEPMECMANAFNRPECADTIRLEPGAERSFRCGIEFPVA